MAKKAQTEDRCILTLPLLAEPYQIHLMEKRFKIMEHLQNSLVALELRKLRNLQRTRKWRALEEQIRETPKEGRKVLYRERGELLKEAGFSEFQFKDDMTNMQKHFVEHIAVHVAHRAASDVWRAFDKHLYHGGKRLHFKKRGTLSSIANQKAGNAMAYRDGSLIWSGGQGKNSIKLKIRVRKPDTLYEQEMLKKEMKYFRVVRKWIKDEYKYYVQFTLVGEPVRKEREIGQGRVGIDIGTQSAAIVSEERVSLIELADRVNDNHRKLLALQRKMDASRRATNPDNYADDGTIRRGIRLKWVKSRRYERLAGAARELQRKNADIRKYQHTCLANEILRQGTEVYVEDMDFRSLQRRAKQTTKNAAGRFNRKKRFGKSLANKAPAEFLTILSGKLEAAGGALYRVDKWEYRASQYDHLSRAYSKKKLRQRLHIMENGDVIQRDLYSAFLIMNADESLKAPDQERCENTYRVFKELHDREIARIQREEKPHLSSFGIA